jgi:hypothetical protein
MTRWRENKGKAEEEEAKGAPLRQEEAQRTNGPKRTSSAGSGNA